MHVHLPVFGMHCERCVASVTRALTDVAGVQAVQVTLPTEPGPVGSVPGRADVEGTAEPALLAAAVLAAGFAVTPQASAVADNAAPAVQEAPAAPAVASSADNGIGLQIEGMTCAACVSTVEKALRAVPGVRAVSVNFADESAWIEGDASTAALFLAVQRAGYSARPHTDVLASESADASPGVASADIADAPTALLWRAALALLAGAIFMGYDMRFGVPTGPMGIAISAGCLALMWVCGARYYRGAWAAARRGSGTMDTLIASGTLSAWLYSTVQVLAPDWLMPATHSAVMGHGFFDSALMIVGFVGLGQGLELRARRTSNRAIQTLLALAPDTALRLRDNQETVVRVAEIEVGDWLRVRPGERIAVDARVLDGTSHIDEAMLTGEPMPVRRGPGDRLAAGTLNGEHALIVEAVGVGRDTAVARIVRLVRRAQGAKPAIAELTDRIAAVFVPVVLLIAVCTALLWWFLGPTPAAPYALRTALAVLIIACPCALGLATPLSVLVAVGRAAGLGVLIRDGRALELAGRVQLLLLDKTGTLTEGKPRVRALRCAADVTETTLLQVAATLAANSRHPVSAAISAEANARGITLQQASAVREIAGAGVEGDIGGTHCRLGQLDWLRAAMRVASPELDDAARPADVHEDTTQVHVLRDGRWLGCVYVADALRADSLAGLARLRAAGVQVVLLSGDAPRAVAAMAARAGIEHYQGGVSPAGKLQEIVRQQAAGRVVGMVGDGINDAPALAAADVGFAMSEGAAVAVESADVTLLRQSLNAVADAVLLSRATRINIRENLFGAFIYNVVAIPIAAGLLWPFTGWLLSPMLASAAMAASSLTVVANALRLRRVPLRRFEHQRTLTLP